MVGIGGKDSRCKLPVPIIPYHDRLEYAYLQVYMVIIIDDLPTCFTTVLPLSLICLLISNFGNWSSRTAPSGLDLVHLLHNNPLPILYLGNFSAFSQDSWKHMPHFLFLR